MPTQPRSVLIADDNAELRKAMKIALETAGYRVRVAANGRDALVLQREDPAEILVTDIFMPESDGFEAITGFRNEFPGTKIIAISGDASKVKREYLPVAALIGVDATLRKPFDRSALLQALNSVLEG